MRLSSLSVPLCVATGARATHTLSEVRDQVSAYRDQNDTRVAPSGCALACGFLASVLPQRLSYRDSPAYELEQSRYWSQQQALTEPACRFSPASADEVSLAVLTVRVAECRFAVKSGGHAAFAGASNIDGGLAIDLAGLDEIAVSDDGTQTSVGAGNVWYDVYTHLQPLGLAVIGGRVSAIGVGGLTLGGGMSFFSGRYGWACDNVNTYEVVLADGSVHNVSHASHSDLYWALRGGGNNFGIVTRFDLATFAQGDLWAGSRTFVYSDEAAAAVSDAFYYFAANSPADPFAQVIVAYAYAQAQGTYVIAVDLQYGKPVANPPILRNFTSIPGAVADTLRTVDLANLTVEFNDTNPGGFRQTYWTLTVGNSPSLMADIVAIYREEVDQIKDAEGIVPSAVFQPVTTDMTAHFSKNGGNALGLDGQGPLNLINIDVSWSDAADDERILAAVKSIIDRSAAAATDQGLDRPYLYQNYASLQQDVFLSYGEENLARLKAVSAKYDPERVWQELQPGYFKL